MVPHRAIGQEAADAGAHNDSSPQRCSAAHHVDCSAASKINDTRPKQVVGGVGSGPGAAHIETSGGREPEKAVSSLKNRVT